MVRTDRDNRIPYERLTWRCDPAELNFRTTEEIDDSDSLFGQDRAMEAIRLAAEIPQHGFNLFVLGPAGTRRHFAVNEVLKSQAISMPTPDDWVYVNNFEAPHRPKALRLPAGTAQALKAEIDDLVDDLAIDIPALFESDDYQTTRRTIEEEYAQRQEEEMAAFAERVQEEQIALIRTPMGFMLVATRDGEVVKNEDFQKLPDDEQAAIEEKIATFQQELSKILRNAPKIDRERRHRIEQLNAELTGQVVTARVEETMRKFSDTAVLQDYLAALCKDMTANAEMFLAFATNTDEGPFPDKLRKAHRDPWFHPYMVNVMVAHPGDAEHGAPVQVEDLPTLDRLTGRIEHQSKMGALVTDFTMIKPGVLHRANGGYLVVDARRLLSEPMAWPALKQCLRTRTITIASMAERLSLLSTISLEPEPIPLETRVVLVGDRLLYALLVTLDPEFGELFKLEAEFEEDIKMTPDARDQFSRLVAVTARKHGLMPLDAGGVARAIDEAVRLTSDRSKLSLHLEAINDLLCEADHYARREAREYITSAHIAKAVSEKERRGSRIKDRVREAIARGTIMIDAAGDAVGQVNGLSVVGLGNYRFGRPSRITARTRLGGGKLVDIEREVELGGPLHSKGVLILAGYLSSTYALDMPFSLHASLVFEQSYGNIDGDSASAAELFALLSSLSDVPIRQSFAVTGSVNQTGEIQAIGGVNEKVEGFYEVCLDKGLTGDQGVLIPSSNLDHLLLRDDILQAVKDGRFHVYAIGTVNQGIEILTGRMAGSRRADGAFPPGSINARVEEKLANYASRLKELARHNDLSDTDK